MFFCRPASLFTRCRSLRICASFTPRWTAKSRRHLATFVYFHRLTAAWVFGALAQAMLLQAVSGVKEKSARPDGRDGRRRFSLPARSTLGRLAEEINALAGPHGVHVLWNAPEGEVEDAPSRVAARIFDRMASLLAVPTILARTFPAMK